MKTKRFSSTGEFLQGLLLLGVAFFLIVSFLRLDRFPSIHFDEIGILDPGYKFWTEGVFGSDLYKGFHEQDRIYLEVLPLMSLLTGAATRAFGAGIFQMRMVPVLAGAGTILMTYWAARMWWEAAERKEEKYISSQRKISSWFGLTVVTLLLFWQWTPTGANPYLGSGIPLFDVARLARYDILVAFFGVSAFGFWLKARKDGSLVLDVISGFLAGLAGLSNVYGLFWGIALPALLLVDTRVFTRRALSRPLLAFLIPFLAVMSTWGIVILFNWETMLGQFVKHGGRFNFLDWRFYLDSLAREPHRYNLGFRQPGTYFRVGFWLLILGLPVSWILLAMRTWRQKLRAGPWLLLPCLLFPLLLALLVNEKRFYYLIAITPFFATLLAWGTWKGIPALLALRTFPANYKIGPSLAAIFLLTLLGCGTLQGIAGIIRLQQDAARVQSPETFFRALNETIPSEGTVLGPQRYWHAIRNQPYHAMLLSFHLSSIYDPTPISFEEALEQIHPDFIIIDPYLESWLELSEDPDPRSMKEQFETFMESHEAKLIAELVDHEGQPVQVFRLTWVEKAGSHD